MNEDDEDELKGREASSSHFQPSIDHRRRRRTNSIVVVVVAIAIQSCTELRLFFFIFFCSSAATLCIGATDTFKLIFRRSFPVSDGPLGSFFCLVQSLFYCLQDRALHCEHASGGAAVFVASF
jgi:hypothetical protein